jgi:hypothetical protein
LEWVDEENPDSGLVPVSGGNGCEWRVTWLGFEGTCQRSQWYCCLKELVIKTSTEKAFFNLFKYSGCFVTF